MERFIGAPQFEKLATLDSGGGNPTQPEKLVSVEQLEKPEWIPLSSETFAQFFPNENSMGRRVFPLGDLFQRRRTALAIERAMEEPIKWVEGLNRSGRFLN